MIRFAVALRWVAAAGLLACSTEGVDPVQPDVPPAPDDTDDMVVIPAGPVMLGSPEGSGFYNEHPQQYVQLPSFAIDRLPVTVNQYAAFLREHGNVCLDTREGVRCVDCARARLDCDTFEPLSVCQNVPGGPATESCGEHPVIGLSWYGAKAYCEWRGARLLTEPEWERAAQGPLAAGDDDGRLFPWGEECPASWRSVALKEGGEPYQMPHCDAPEWTPATARTNCLEAWCHDGFTSTSPVGSFPGGATAEGVLDMAGNTWEWVSERIIANPEELVDPDEPKRGGSAIYWPPSLRGSHRGEYDPVKTEQEDIGTGDYFGTRCARSL